MDKKKKTVKSKNSFANNILQIFNNNPLALYNYRQIAKKLGCKDSASKQIVHNTILDLVVKKELVEVKTGKYQINNACLNENKFITGIVDMTHHGTAYIISEETDKDIKISPKNIHHALNGDVVKVFLFTNNKRTKQEGQIVEIISRAKKQFVGKIEICKNFAFLIPDNQYMSVDIYIPLNELNGAKNGEKALAEITDWPNTSKNPFGKILHVLGKPGSNDVEMQSILAEFDFPLSFPISVEKEANKISDTIIQAEIYKRKDFRNITTFTIDPVDAKDFDDALSINKMKNNNWEVGIHIADVSHYIEENSLLDKEAFKRGTSVYLVDRVIPMLPERLSNGVCSLKPNEDKLCFSAVFEMNNEAEIINKWFGKTIINSNRRFTYEEVQNIIETDKGDFAKEIKILNHLAYKLRDKRFKKGSIAFESTEVKFRLDEKGKPIGVYIKEQKDSHKLVEDFMLLANRKVAEFIGKQKDQKQLKTFIYRIHNQPTPEKLHEFSDFVSKIGYQMKTDTRKNIVISFNKLFEQITGKTEENIVNQLAIRTMAKAYYSTENIGHYGLAFSLYTHFTSPIRRYPDLMVHRLLNKYLQNGNSADKKEYEKRCKYCSEMEKKAEQAERASVKYKQVEFLQDKIGYEFNGIISGVTRWGIYVEITENHCEGMISLKAMEDDYYYLDEDNYCVIGQRYGNKYKLGDKIRIKVKHADLSKKQLDFIRA